MSRDPANFVRSLEMDLRSKLQGRLSELDQSAAKAEDLIRSVRAEQAEIKKALRKLDRPTRPGEITPRILAALEDGPRTKEELADTLGVNGSKRQLHGSLMALVRHGHATKDDDGRYALVEEAA